jgi:hypothetical protein
MPGVAVWTAEAVAVIDGGADGDADGVGLDVAVAGAPPVGVAVCAGVVIAAPTPGQKPDSWTKRPPTCVPTAG